MPSRGAICLGTAQIATASLPGCYKLMKLLCDGRMLTTKLEYNSNDCNEKQTVIGGKWRRKKKQKGSKCNQASSSVIARKQLMQTKKCCHLRREEKRSILQWIWFVATKCMFFDDEKLGLLQLHLARILAITTQAPIAGNNNIFERFKLSQMRALSLLHGG